MRARRRRHARSCPRPAPGSDQVHKETGKDSPRHADRNKSDHEVTGGRRRRAAAAAALGGGRRRREVGRGRGRPILELGLWNSGFTVGRGFNPAGGALGGG
ncbi:hypothetical protein F511_21266 [Dorcoceras hygrometricum]|uniref:Uncharacterized protein n=1 Tax=Dorcoceras hygrometricum TaxID=472368 RepID=A0A2Z7B474_9LAMI|nr:hypothetical protein F511_21266 [Dorcoceras hygrometricum]